MNTSSYADALSPGPLNERILSPRVKLTQSQQVTELQLSLTHVMEAQTELVPAIKLTQSQEVTEGGFSCQIHMREGQSR